MQDRRHPFRINLTLNDAQALDVWVLFQALRYHAQDATDVIVPPSPDDAWTEEALARLRMRDIFDHAYLESEHAKPPEELALAVLRNVLRTIDGDDIWLLDNQYGVLQTSTGLELVTDEYGDILEAAQAVLAIVAHYNLPPVGFDWGAVEKEDPQDPSGAVICTAAGPEMFFTTDWIEARLEELAIQHEQHQEPAPTP